MAGRYSVSVQHRRDAASRVPRRCGRRGRAMHEQRDNGTGRASVDAAANDDRLLEAIQRRDAAGLAALYDRYGRSSYGLAYRLLGEREAAEAVVEEAFLLLWRRAGEVRAQRGAVEPWLMTIVRRLAIERRRGAVSATGDPSLDAVAAIEADRIRAVADALPAEEREAIELAYFDGLTHAEIAERTGVTSDAVKERLRLGLRRLREGLEDRQGKRRSRRRRGTSSG